MVSDRIKRRTASSYAIEKPVFTCKKGGRSKTGCFCCRKRKIKCGGEKPNCRNCDKASYMCVWPKGNESLPHKSTFTLTKLDQRDWIVETKETKMKEEQAPKHKKKLVSCEPNPIILEKYEDELEEANEVGRLNVAFDNSMMEPMIINSNDQPISTSISSELLEDLEYFSNVESSVSSDENEYQSMELDNGFIVNTDLYPSIDELFKTDIVDSAIGTTTVIKNVKGINLKKIQKEIEEDIMFRMYLIDVNSSLHHLSEINLASDESILFDAFIGGFIPCISPQFAHIKLQPGPVFIPFGLNNNALKSLFLGCGASFLACANNNKEMELLSVIKSRESVSQLKAFLSQSSSSESCDWLMIFTLLFYLKQSFFHDKRESLTVNMITSAEILKLWIMKKEKRPNFEFFNDFQWEKMNDCNSFNTLNITKTFCDLVDQMKNSMSRHFEKPKPTAMRRRNSQSILDPSNLELQIMQKENCHTEILPYQRTILESFIYNYTDSLFNPDKKYIHLLTSPYDIFEGLRPYLLSPIFNCAVPWMNNPVVGASISVVELQAKICWLALQSPLSEKDRIEAQNIINLAYYFTPPILPLKVHQKEPEPVQRRLMESCYGSVIMAKAIVLYGMKLLNPNLLADDPEVQKIVNCALDYISKLSVLCQSSGTLIWSFTIIGVAVIDKKQREYLKWRLQNFGTVLKISKFQRLLEFFDIAWGRNYGQSWDALFDTESLATLPR